MSVYNVTTYVVWKFLNGCNVQLRKKLTWFSLDLELGNYFS